MKPRPTNALERWMRDNHYSDTAFASALNEILAKRNERPVSARSVAKWRLSGHPRTVPRPATQEAIMSLTRGAVTPTDLVTAA